MTCLRIGFLIGLVFSPCLSSALEGFHAQAPQDWIKVEDSPGYAIYQNRHSQHHELVVLRKIKTGHQGERLQTDLKIKTTEVAAARGRFFERLGLKNYFISDIAKQKLEKSPFKYMQVLHSHFVDTQAQTVQWIERQYVSKHQMWTVSYLIDAEFIEDEKRVSDILDRFQPFPSSVDRGVASETLAVGDGDLGEIRGSIVEPAFQNPDTDKKQCEVRSLDRTFKESLKAVMPTCLTGLKEMVKGLVLAARDAAITAYDSYQSGEYGDQINAAVGVAIAAFKKDPVGLSIKVGDAILNLVVPYKRFMCGDTDEKIKVACQVVADVVAAGAIFKLLRGLVKVSEVTEMIDGVPHTRLAATAEDSMLSKVITKSESRGQGVFTREKWDNGVFAEQNFHSNGQPYIVIRPNLLKEPENLTSSLAEEVTHATNATHFTKSPVRSARGTAFRAETELKTGEYKSEIRLDEVHARAVRGGVELHEAEKALADGDRTKALSWLEKAQTSLDEGRLFQSESLRQLKTAKGVVGNENVATYAAGQQMVEVKIPGGGTRAPMCLEELRLIRDSNGMTGVATSARTDGASIEIHVGPQPSAVAARKEAGRAIDLAIQDTSRFSKTFQAQREKISKIRAQLSLPELE